LLQRYPELQTDQNSTSSPQLLSKIRSDTTLAISLSQEFEFGMAKHVTGGAAIIGTKPYGDLWTPDTFGSFAEQMMQRGATLEEVYSCLHDKYGFDEDFTAASINYAHTRGAVYYWCAFLRPSCLDPTIYGENPYVIKVNEPTWIFQPNGNITLFRGPGSPEDYLLKHKLHIGVLFGGGWTMLALPESVATKFTKNEIMRLSSMYTVWAYNIQPNGTEGLPQYTSSDMTRMVEAYANIHNAITDFSMQKGLDINSLTRVPFDSRLPEEFRKSLSWIGFPDPLQAVMDGLFRHDGQCQVVGGNLVNCKPYADKVYSYLLHTGMFSQPQRTQYIGAYLGNYVGKEDLAKIPTSQLQDYKTAQNTYRNIVNQPHAPAEPTATNATQPETSAGNMTVTSTVTVTVTTTRLDLGLAPRTSTANLADVVMVTEPQPATFDLSAMLPFSLPAIAAPITLFVKHREKKRKAYRPVFAVIPAPPPPTRNELLQRLDELSV